MSPEVKESPKPGCWPFAFAATLAIGALGGGFAWLLAAVH